MSEPKIRSTTADDTKLSPCLPETVTVAEINARNRKFWAENGGETQGASPDEVLTPWGGTQ